MAGNFERLNVIGSGTYGEAWLARHVSTDNKCVIKVIKILKLSEKEIDQCLTEVSVLARCNHKNIVKYLDAFVGNGELNIAMEYANGGDLHRKIVEQRGIHFGKEVILDWFVQICLALKYIHQQNILHRDLKTQNIFLGKGNIIKVGDFGIARILRDRDDHALTAVGTPFYLSPEICQRKPYNFKSDMWAAGCVLYELCCLRVPFNAQDFQQLTMNILQGVYEPLPRYLGSTLNQLVTKLLDVDAEKRFSAEEIVLLPDLNIYVKRHSCRSQTVTSKKWCDQTDIRPVNMMEKVEYKGVRPKVREMKVNKEGKDEVEMVQVDDKKDCADRAMLEDHKVGKTYKVKNPKFRRLSLATPRIQGIVARQRANLSADSDKRSVDYEDNPKQKLFKNLKEKRTKSTSCRNPSVLSNDDDDVFMKDIPPSSHTDENNNNEGEVMSGAAVAGPYTKNYEKTYLDSVNSKTYSVQNPRVIEVAKPSDLNPVNDVTIFTAKTLYKMTVEAKTDSRAAIDHLYMKLIKLTGQKRLKYLMYTLSEAMKMKKDFSTFKDILSSEELMLFPLIMQYHCLSDLLRGNVPG